MDIMMQVENVSLTIGHQRILQSVSLDVTRGEVLGIVGPNGAGKTSLMRVMGGLLPPSQGTVKLDGRNMRALSAKERARQIAFVRQDANIGFGFTVHDVVNMGRYPYVGKLIPFSVRDVQFVKDAMEQVGITHLKERRMTELSGGEKKRVFLARAIAQQSELLFLDEPTANLDIRYELELLSYVRELNEAGGVTVVTALHDLELASDYCDRLIVMKDGAMAASGTPADVMTEDLIAEVFGVIATIERHDQTGRPMRISYVRPG